MKFESWLTRQASSEARRMVRPWTYWPTVVYGFGFLGLVLVLGFLLLVKGLLAAPSPDLPRAAGGGLLIVIVIGFALRTRSRSERRQAEFLAKVNPSIVALEADGLHVTRKSGAINFMPWSGYDGFREGASVILLRKTGTRSYVEIGKKTVPPEAAGQLISAIRSRLPEIGKKASVRP